MTMPSDEDIGRVVGEVTIAYSVKELLSRIEERVVRLDQKMTHLPSREELEELRKMVQELRKIVDQHEARWNRVLGASLAIAVLGGGAAGWVTSLLGG